VRSGLCRGHLISTKLMLHGIIIIEKIILMLAGVKVLTRCIFCNTMPATLLAEQRKMIVYNKTLRSNNIVLRILCALHRNEA